jgi:hypothetical protein
MLYINYIKQYLKIDNKNVWIYNLMVKCRSEEPEIQVRILLYPQIIIHIFINKIIL